MQTLFYLAALIDGKSLPGSDGGSIVHEPGTNTLLTVFNIIFRLAGAIAVLVVVIAGFRYIRAGSNETITAEARRQLVHALVGLVVIASAATIVNFVLDRAA